VLEEFGSDLWVADGPTLIAAAGFHYPTRMAVIRLSGGDLFLWSPIAISDALLAGVKELGRVRHLVAPNMLHHTYLRDWQRAFPNASVYGPRGLSEKRKDVTFNSFLGESPAPPAWSGQIDLVAITNNRITTEFVFFHRQSETAIFTDLIQHFEPGWFTGWRALVARLDLMVASEPSVPRKFRIAFADRAAAREALKRILAWPTKKVLFAHGDPVTEDAQAFLCRAFRWL
jgi:hypothetical protein